MARRTKPNVFQRTMRSILASDVVKNAVGDDIAGVPLFNQMTRETIDTRDFGNIELQDREYYAGQLFGAIRTRANRVAHLANNNLESRIFGDFDTDIDEVHPYLPLIDESPTFTNDFFWQAMSTFLDLKGTAFILAVRNFSGDRRGTVQEFQIINPYEMTRVSNKEGKLGGYVETRGGRYRVIPKEQLIVVHSLNPFNLEEGFAMVEAAKEDQYQIKQGKSYTRDAIKKNVGQRGAITTDVILSDEKFANFVQAVKGSSSGDFIFGNGPGALNYQDMQIDLDKLALDKINSHSKEDLVAVHGASKTLLAIEQSQISQEQAKVQRELFTENHAIPQLQYIIGGLNQDYKNSYTREYQTKKIVLYIDSPLKVDKEQELKEANIQKVKADTAKVLIDAGYDPQSVSEYLEIEDLEFEERQKPQGQPMPPGQFIPDEDKESGTKPEPEETENKIALNSLHEGLEPLLRGYEVTLANQIGNIEAQILESSLENVSEKVAKNALSEAKEKDLISKKDKEKAQRDVQMAIAAFFLAIIPLLASQTSSKRLAEFKLPSQFEMTDTIRETVKEHAVKAAESHVGTVLEDIYNTARTAAQEGLGRGQIIARLHAKYQDLSRIDATRIARTETYKAVNQAQYEADKQFIEQNGLQNQAYKRWITQSDNPCPFCQKMNGSEVPFYNNFLELGDTVTASFKNKGNSVQRERIIGYEPIGTGTLHPNCSCAYVLVVKNQGDLAFLGPDIESKVKATMNEKELDFIDAKGINIVKGKPSASAARGAFKPSENTVLIRSTASGRVLFHEFGHAIDYNARVYGSAMSQNAGIAKDLVERHRHDVLAQRLKSDKLADMSDADYLVVAKGGTTAEGFYVPDEMLAYLSDNREIFADAYAQFRTNPTKFAKMAPDFANYFKELL